MKHKRIGALLLVLCMIVTMFPITAFAATSETSETDVVYAVTGGNIYFDEGTGTITGADETITEAIIPEQINGVEVVEIGDMAFNGCEKMKSVSIPDSVMEIGIASFAGCYVLEEVNLPEGIDIIKGNTFNGCEALSSIVIPDGVEMIVDLAFTNSMNLKSVYIPESVTYIGEGILECTQLSDVYYGGTKEQWDQITICAYNDRLKTATFHYNCKGIVISEDIIAYVDMPVPGEHPQMECEIEGLENANYTATVEWKESHSGKKLTASDTFKLEGCYSYKIELKTKKGYVFEGIGSDGTSQVFKIIGRNPKNPSETTELPSYKWFGLTEVSTGYDFYELGVDYKWMVFPSDVEYSETAKPLDRIIVEEGKTKNVNAYIIRTVDGKPEAYGFAYTESYLSNYDYADVKNDFSPADPLPVKKHVITITGEKVTEKDITLELGTSTGQQWISGKIPIAVVEPSKPARPKAPSSVDANLCTGSGGYNDITVKWTAPSGGASGYAVYMKKGSGNYVRKTYTTRNSYTIKDLSDGVKYTFKIVPYYESSSGEKYFSTSYKTDSVYTLKKVTLSSVSKNGTKVKVKWANISGETGYQISKSTSKTGTNIVSTYKTTSGTYKNISAAKGRTYYYKVRAYKVVGGKKVYGPWSIVKKYKR